MSKTPHLTDIERNLTSLRGIFEGEPLVLAAYLFGSVAEQRASPLSDVDFALLLAEGAPRGLDRLVVLDRIACKLADVFGVSERDVDAVALNDLGLVMQHRVLSKGRLLFERDPDARQKFAWRVHGRYLDFAPTLAIYNRAAGRSSPRPKGEGAPS